MPKAGYKTPPPQTFISEHQTGTLIRPEPASERSIHVLVVEDDESTQSAIREFLQMKGMKVDTASDGIRAIEAFECQVYDVIVTDIRLPGTNGVSVTRAAQKCDPPLPVIVITAYPEWHDDTMNLGAAQILRKPLDLQQLAEHILEEAGDAPSQEWSI
ncbi:MAG: response regulator [Planctomycetota bacterium]|jgi:DNA-binding response OmpR family regulator